MDRLKDSTLHALETVINDAEDLSNTQISQSIIDEALLITNELGQRTVMNCALNSVGATIRQVCKHINNKTLFSYEEDYKLATSKLPRTITKLDLFEEAQRRFQKWVDMYADSSISIEQMYDDMSCSSYSGDPAFDFPDDVKAMQEVK